ncbi:MAG: hypothetical protein NVSMB42_11190 [Herpetosiphon sp.]
MLGPLLLQGSEVFLKRVVAGRRLALLLFLLVCVVQPSGAAAHAQLIRTEPASGAVLASTPPSARLWYSERIDQSFSDATLVDATGKPVRSVQRAGVGADDPQRLELPLPTLQPGLYTVVWHVVSADDGHKTTGTLVFTISGGGTTAAAQQVPPPPTLAADVEAPINIGGAINRWVQLVGLILIFGGVVTGLAVLRPFVVRFGSPAEQLLLPAWRRVMQAGLVVLLVGAVTTLVLQWQLVQSGSPVSADDLAPLLLSRWGLVWSGRLGLVLLLVPLLGSSYWGLRRRVLWAALGLCLLLLGTFSLVSHGAALQHGRGVGIATDWLHVLSAATWSGALVVLLVLLLRLRAIPGEQRTPMVLDLVGRFSRVAVLAVIGIVLSGTYSAVLQLHTPQELLVSSYGRILLVKMLLVLVPFALGAYHWLMARAHLAAVQGSRSRVQRLLRRLNRTVGLEALMAMGVLLVVGVLVQAAPPLAARVQAPPTPGGAVTATAAPMVVTAAPNVPFNTTVISGGLTIGLEMDAKAVGNRTFTVTVRDDRGPVLPDRVRLRVRGTDMDMGVTLVDAAATPGGSFVASSPVMSMSGQWQVDVIIRRRGVPDVIAPIKVSIP